MPEDVIVAEPVAAVVQTPAVISNDYSKVVAQFTPEERHQWSLTGEEPERFKTPATPATEPEKKPTPAPEKAEVKADAGTADDDDQEPEYYGSPEQIKAQRKAFGRLRNERATLKAENKLLREQKAANTPAAPATAPKAEVKSETGALAEPELPNIADYDDPKKYHEDLKQYHRDVRAWDRAQLQQETQQREQSTHWGNEVRQAKEAHPDFEAVAFSDRVPASLPMLGVLMGMKGGAELFYHFGKNPDDAAALAAETEIPGEFRSYAELAKAADSNPALARALGAAEAIVRSEVKRILAGTKKPDPTPKPITKTNAPSPGSRVNANTPATGDPIQDAYARGDYAEGARLEALADMERQKRR